MKNNRKWIICVACGQQSDPELCFRVTDEFKVCLLCAETWLMVDFHLNATYADELRTATSLAMLEDF